MHPACFVWQDSELVLAILPSLLFRMTQGNVFASYLTRQVEKNTLNIYRETLCRYLYCASMAVRVGVPAAEPLVNHTTNSMQQYNNNSVNRHSPVNTAVFVLVSQTYFNNLYFISICQ